MVILLNQSIKDVKDSYFIPLSLVRSFIVVRLHPYEQVSLLVNYKRKNVGACICPFVVRGLPQPMRKTDRETPTLEYIDYTVKCAYESNTYSRSTLRSLIYTPRGSYPCIVLVLSSIVVVSKRPKTKRQ